VSIEADRMGISLIVDIFIRAYKAKKLGLLFEMIVAALLAKQSWDTAIGRLKGEFYGQLVEGAVNKFKNEHPADFVADTSGVEDGAFDRWKAAQKEDAAALVARGGKQHDQP